MIKNEYLKPAMQVMLLSSQTYMGGMASAQTSGLKDNENDPDLHYDKNGGDQRYAW